MSDLIELLNQLRNRMVKMGIVPGAGAMASAGMMPPTAPGAPAVAPGGGMPSPDVMMMGGMTPPSSGSPEAMMGGMMPGGYSGGGTGGEGDLAALLGLLGGGEAGGLGGETLSAPSPMEPSPPETSEAPTKINNTTIYLELVKVRKLLTGLYRNFGLPIPEDVLSDEAIILGKEKPKVETIPSHSSQEKSEEEEEEGNLKDLITSPVGEIPSVGGAKAIKPITKKE